MLRRLISKTQNDSQLRGIAPHEALMYPHFYVGYNVHDQDWCVFLTCGGFKVYSRWPNEHQANIDALARTKRMLRTLGVDMRRITPSPRAQIASSGGASISPNSSRAS